MKIGDLKMNEAELNAIKNIDAAYQDHEGHPLTFILCRSGGSYHCLDGGTPELRADAEKAFSGPYEHVVTELSLGEAVSALKSGELYNEHGYGAHKSLQSGVLSHLGFHEGVAVGLHDEDGRITTFRTMEGTLINDVGLANVIDIENDYHERKSDAVLAEEMRAYGYEDPTGRGWNHFAEIASAVSWTPPGGKWTKEAIQIAEEVAGYEAHAHNKTFGPTDDPIIPKEADIEPTSSAPTRTRPKEADLER